MPELWQINRHLSPYYTGLNRVYRIVPDLPIREQLVSGSSINECSFFDASFPTTYSIKYRVAAVDANGIERGSRTSNTLDPISVQTWNIANRAPTIGREAILRHTFKNTAMSLGSGRLQLALNAKDMDGDTLHFEVTKVISGTLQITTGTTTLTFTPTTVFSEGENPKITPGSIVKWTPMLNKIGSEIEAFEIRADDGALKSPTAGVVKIEVRDTSVLQWWGSWILGHCGNGTSPLLNSHVIEQYWQQNIEHWTVDPAIMLKDPAYVSSGDDSRIANVVQIAASDVSWPPTGARAALTADGAVWVWGTGRYGLLGDGQLHTPSGANSPELAPYFTQEAKYPIRAAIADVQMLADGAFHMLALKTDGTVWGWGLGELGQLGVPPESLPSVASAEYQASVGQPSTIRATSSPQQVPGLANIASVYAIDSLSLAISAQGEVFYWGDWLIYSRGDSLFHEQTCWPRRLNFPGRIVQLASPGAGSILALTDEGDVWGVGDAGSFNFGASYEDAVQVDPVKVPIAGVASIAAGNGHCVAILKDGTAKQWGSLRPSIENSRPVAVRGLANVKKVRTNGQAALAVADDGHVWGWGSAFNGILGQFASATPEEWESAYSLKGAAFDFVVGTPKFGYYAYPIQLDSIEQVEDVAVTGEAAFAVASVHSLAPRGLAAQSRDGSVLLSWKRYGGAVSYELQRSFEENSGWQTYATVNDDPNQTKMTWLDTGVSNGKIYWYKVRAIVKDSVSDFSNPVSALPNPEPPKVTGLTVEVLPRSVHVYWAEASKAISYEVWRDNGDGKYLPILKDYTHVESAPVWSCGSASKLDGRVDAYDVALKAGATYHYKVRALNQNGFGPFSDSVESASILANDSTHSAPSVTAAVDSMGVHLSWDKRNDTPADTEYLITMSRWHFVKSNGSITLTEGMPELVEQVHANEVRDSTSFTRSIALAAGHRYTVRVSEFTPCRGGSAPTGEGLAWSQTVEPQQSNPPGGTIQTMLVKGAPGSVYFRWRGEAVNYMVALKKNSDNSYHNECTPFDVVEPDENGIAEYFLADTALGAGDYTLEVSVVLEDWASPTATTIPITIPAGGSNLALPSLNVNAADNRMTITWWGSDEDAWNKKEEYAGWRFILQRSDPTSCPQWVTVYDGTEMGIEDVEVKNGLSYSYRVFGISPDLGVVKETTASASQPAPSFAADASIVFTAVPRNGAIQLNWNTVASGATEVDEYELHGASTDVEPFPILRAFKPGDVPSETISGVKTYLFLGAAPNKVARFYRLYARKKNGDFLVSAKVTATPSAAADLIAPQGIFATVANDKVYVQWTDSPGAESYEILYGGVTTSTKLNSFAVGFPHSDSGPRYDFQITAKKGTKSAAAYFTFLTWWPANGEFRYGYKVFRGSDEIANLPSAAREFFETRYSSSSVTYLVKACQTADCSMSDDVVKRQLDSDGPIQDPKRFKLGDLPTTIVSPTNIVIGVSIDTSVPTSRVEFYIDDVLVGIDSTAPDYSYRWINPTKTAGTSSHKIQARLVCQENFGSFLSEAKQVQVSVVPALKSFQTAATDLQIPTPVMPLAAARSYDSRDLSSGMLGKGWRMDWERAGMTIPDLSMGWQFIWSDNILKGRALLESPIHIMEVRLPSGEIQQFHPTAGNIAFADRFDPLESFGDDPLPEELPEIDLFYVPLPGSEGVMAEVQPQIGPTRVTIQNVNTYEPLMRYNNDYRLFVPGQPEKDSYLGFAYTNLTGTQFLFKGPLIVTDPVVYPIIEACMIGCHHGQSSACV